jgi:hypothetical protein
MPFALDHDVSEEILDCIASLCSQDSQASLSRCSKKLNRITTPHLYSVVNLRASHGSSQVWLLPFAHLIFTSPLHASFVRSFATQEGWGDEVEPEEPREAVGSLSEYKRPWPQSGTAELRDCLKKICAKYTMDEDKASRLYEKIKDGVCESAIIALLIASFANLQKLDLCYGFFPSDGMIELFERTFECVKTRNILQSDQANSVTNSKATPPNPTPFSLPLDVLGSGTDDKCPHDPLFFAVLLKLPNLRSIYGWKFGDEDGMIDDQRDDAFSRLEPRSCPVEYIECRSSKFHHENLNYVMSAAIPGKLKSFVYEIGCTWAWVNVDHRKIMKSMEPHYETLECLGLSHEEFYPYQFDNEAERPDPVSMQCFKSLKQLKVAPVYIFGHEGFNEDRFTQNSTKEMLWKALPGTLEELWITRAQGQGESAATAKFVPTCLIPAMNLVIQNRGCYSRLSQIRIELPIEDWTADWLDQLVSFCHYAEINGIRCTIILNGRAVGKRNVPLERGWGWNEDVEWSECVHNRQLPNERIVVAEQHNLGDTLKARRASYESFIASMRLEHI